MLAPIAYGRNFV